MTSPGIEPACNFDDFGYTLGAPAVALLPCLNPNIEKMHHFLVETCFFRFKLGSFETFDDFARGRTSSMKLDVQNSGLN